MSEVKQIPKLRFSEFSDEWNTNPFKRLVKVSQGLQINISDRLTEQEEGSLFYITNEFLRENSEKKYYIKDAPKSVICNEDDILMTRTGNTGKVVTNVSGAFHNNFFKIAYPKDIDKNFLVNYLNLYKTQSRILRLAGTSTIPDLNHSDFYKINFVYPKLKEQQKIAAFLRAVDKKITQLQDKKTLLEQYKKGVMQKIFSQELRFKDDHGNNYPDWKEKELGQIGNVINGLTYSPKDIDKNGVLVLRSSNVQNRVLTFDDNVYVNVDEGNFNPIKENDILICVRNGSKRLIGKNAIIDKPNVGVTFGAFMAIYRSVYNLFLFHLFDTDFYKKQVYVNLGATINSINGSDLKKFIVPFPSVEEQTKIAEFLSAIDDKIELVNTQLKNTQQFKKGLLQQMFV